MPFIFLYDTALFSGGCIQPLLEVMHVDDNFFLKALSEIWGYLWFVFLAIWGGTVSYIRRVKQSGVSFSTMELVGEWTISAFAGLLTAYICKEADISWELTAVATAIAGHMGGRALFIIEGIIKSRFTGKAD